MLLELDRGVASIMLKLEAFQSILVALRPMFVTVFKLVPKRLIGSLNVVDFMVPKMKELVPIMCWVSR